MTDENKIPKQLQNPDFRFVLLGKWNTWRNAQTKEVRIFEPNEYSNINKSIWKPLGKAPFVKSWQENGHLFNSSVVMQHKFNIGVIGGYGNLRILDIDNTQLADELLKKLNTFAVRTGSGGVHFYFISDYANNKILANRQGELRTFNYQVVTIPSRHPSGNLYKILCDLPIKKISAQEMADLISPYLSKQGEDEKLFVPEKVQENKKQDNTRSGYEFRKVLSLLRAGKNRDEVYTEMQLYSKWATSPEQYKNLTFEKAEDFFLQELEQKRKEIEPKKIQVEPTPEILEVLKNPNLFNEITEQELDKKIVGEIETRKVIFLCSAGGRLVENCQLASYNLLINDEAGTGKDYITSKILELLPSEVYIHKTRISPAVFTYWHNSKYEPEWTWNGKVFSAEDISENVLNSDVFKVMASSGSSATIVIKQQAYEINIIGKPIIITTTASATPSPELTRRFVILNLDSSQEQTKAIMKRHSEYRQAGIVPEYNSIYTEAMRHLKRIKVKIPFANLIDKYFPTKSIIMRTHYPRFLDFICASAGFHQFQRQVDGQGYILAEGMDYDIARNCFVKLCSNKYMIPLTILQKQILEIFEKNPTLKVSASQFHGAYNFMSLKSVVFHFEILTKYGILHSETGKDCYSRDLEIYSISNDYCPNEKLEIPTYTEICRNDKVSIIPKVSIVSKVSKTSMEKEKDGLLTLHINPEIDKTNTSKIDFSELDKEFSK